MNQTQTRMDVTLRPASTADLEDLLSISRSCFPDHFRWQSRYLIGRKYWKVVLQSKASQTLVLQDRTGVFAFGVLVLDLMMWESEREQRNGTALTKMFAVLCCPVPAVWTKLLKHGVLRLVDRRQLLRGAGPRSGERPAWAELLAVLPRMHRQGFGAVLMSAFEREAVASQRSVIEAHVDFENTSSRRMCERQGFTLVSSGRRGGCLYRKSLLLCSG